MLLTAVKQREKTAFFFFKYLGATGGTFAAMLGQQVGIGHTTEGVVNYKDQCVSLSMGFFKSEMIQQMKNI